MTAGRHPELAGRVAVITGGAKGIGEAIAKRLALEGMHLVLVDMDADALASTSADLGTSGTQVLEVEGDLAQQQTVEGIFAKAVERFGTVDVLVNNAADLVRRPALEEHDGLLRGQLELNVASPYLCSQRAARIMAANGGGAIINISSVGGLRAHHTGLPYDVTKGAINSMTQAMAIELGQHGIRVNAIAPGVTRTYRWDAASSERRDALAAKIPLGRFGLPSEMAAVAAFLASDDAAYITGQILCVDGGITAQLSPPGPNPL